MNVRLLHVNYSGYLLLITHYSYRQGGIIRLALEVLCNRALQTDNYLLTYIQMNLSRDFT